MRHFHEVMNAEKWNRDDNNESHERADHDNAGMTHNSNNLNVEVASSQSERVEEEETRGKERSAGNSIPDISIPTLPSKTEEVHISQQIPSSSGAFKTKKRVRKSGRLWLFLLAGILISTVSGAALAYWYANRDSTSDIESQVHSIDQNEGDHYEHSEFLIDENDDGYVPDDNNMDMGIETDMPDNELDAAMNKDDIHLDDIEYAEDDIIDYDVDEPSYNTDMAGDSGPGSYLETHREFGIITIKKKPLMADKVPAEEESSSFINSSEDKSTPAIHSDTGKGRENIIMKEESASDEKIAAAISSIRENIRSKEQAVHKELTDRPVTPKSEEKVKETSVKKAPSLIAENKATEKITHTPKKETEEEKTVISSTIAFAAGTQSVRTHTQQVDHKDIKKTGEVPAAVEEYDYIHNENAQKYKKDRRTSSPVTYINTKEEPVFIPLNQDHSPSSDNNVKARSIGKPSVMEPVISASLERKISLHNTVVKDHKTGIPPILKQMSLNYEDRFDTHNNNWPEYEKRDVSAVIRKGEYHIENSTRSGTHAVLHPDAVPFDMDVMINISIGSVRSSGQHSYGLVFGAQDSMNNYSFLVRNGRTYAIEKMSKGVITDIKGGQIDNIFIGGSAQKTIKLVKRKNNVRFYIDGLLIDEIADIDYFGDRTGFLVRGKARMSIDSTQTQIRFQK